MQNETFLMATTALPANTGGAGDSLKKSPNQPPTSPLSPQVVPPPTRTSTSPSSIAVNVRRRRATDTASVRGTGAAESCKIRRQSNGESLAQPSAASPPPTPPASAVEHTTSAQYSSSGHSPVTSTATTTTTTVPIAHDHLLQYSKVVADKYLLLDQAEGSSLYRCLNVNTHEELVCKIVPKERHSLVSAHYRLDAHPCISSLHEVLVGTRYLYLVYPKAHGDLHCYVRHRRRLRETEAKRLFRQIVETVQICHKNGIVLRDLKLRKFVFADSQKTQLKLESLEDAVVLEEPDTDWLNDKRGCPAYVSPEILRAGAQYSGKAADMWSLGVILYTMLVGRYPFNDSEHASLFAKISRGVFIMPDYLSARARCLIRSLLRRDPSERLTSEDISYHPWLAKGEDPELDQLAFGSLSATALPTTPNAAFSQSPSQAQQSSITISSFSSLSSSLSSSSSMSSSQLQLAPCDQVVPACDDFD